MAMSDFSPFLQKVISTYYEKVGTDDTQPGTDKFASFILAQSEEAEKFNVFLKVELPKAVPFENAEEQADIMAKRIWGLARQGKFNLIDELFARYGIEAKDKKFKRFTTEKGRLKVLYGAATESATKGVLQSNSGKLVSQVNLRALLERLTRYYVVQDMTKPSGGGLRYRTGRFAHSVEISGVDASDRTGNVSIFYKYMLRPYQVFDPRYGNKMSSNQRNPQRIIGQAVAKAARDIIHSKYKISIQQGVS